MKPYYLTASAATLVGVLMFIGSLTSWARIQAPFASLTVVGTDTPRGSEFMILGVIMVCLGMLGFVSSTGKRALSGVGIILGSIVCLLAALDTKGNIEEIIATEINVESWAYATVGSGLYVLIVSGIVGVIVGVATLVAASREEGTYEYKAPSLQHLNQKD